MKVNQESIDWAKRLKIAIVIPTYNNDKTLKTGIENCKEFCDDIIVVNDGSTDNTRQILDEMGKTVVCGHLPQNKGKGFALRTAFAKAAELGFRHVITLDSDGQHKASDLPTFYEAIEKEENAIYIGSRQMNQENVPGSSSFGNKFSNFWFRLETGINVPDTQSGYRSYPIHLLKNVHWFTNRYEFEIEVLVRSAWKGVHIIPVPIDVYYPPKEERITHFRKFPDFTRISILNSVLVIITFLWIKPRNFVRALSWANIKKFWYKYFVAGHESNMTKALSVGFGLAMGVLPIWGFQIIAIVALAHVLKLNKAMSLIFSHISLPPFIPWIVLLSMKIGHTVLGDTGKLIDFSQKWTIELAKNHLAQYLVGSILLAVILAIMGFVISFILLSIFRSKK